MAIFNILLKQVKCRSTTKFKVVKGGTTYSKHRLSQFLGNLKCTIRGKFHLIVSKITQLRKKN